MDDAYDNLACNWGKKEIEDHEITHKSNYELMVKLGLVETFGQIDRTAGILHIIIKGHEITHAQFTKILQRLCVKDTSVSFHYDGLTLGEISQNGHTKTHQMQKLLLHKLTQMRQDL